MCSFNNMPSEPQTSRIAHDTADAVNIYTQNKMMPMFSRLDRPWRGLVVEQIWLKNVSHLLSFAYHL